VLRLAFGFGTHLRGSRFGTGSFLLQTGKFGLGGFARFDG